MSPCSEYKESMVRHNKLKIVLTGNCQARPLANLLSRFPDIQVIDVIILHLSNDGEVERHQEIFSAADVIIAQQTIEKFSPQHLSSNKLRDNKKSIIWPNIFFCGQQPFLKYITIPNQGRLIGPLSVYHDVRMLNTWHQFKFGNSLFKESHDDEYAADIARKSLQELQEREQSCDISVSKKIENEWKSHRLFYTFNHPTIRLLSYVAIRIAEKLGVPEKNWKHPQENHSTQ